MLSNLDTYLERYEAEVKRRGGQVHWAATAEDAREIILEICRKANAKTITKGKSMVSEEIGLNDALEAAGHEVIETDLGEYIIQLAKEPPSHIIVPAVHKTKGQIGDLFELHHRPLGYTEHLTEVTRDGERGAAGAARALFPRRRGHHRRQLPDRRDRLQHHRHQRGQRRSDADAWRGCTSSPAASRSVVPTLDDATTFLRLLARSATGQETDDLHHAEHRPEARDDDLDGPEEYHVVLVDNGRSQDAWRGVPRDAALHPLRRLPEPLPGLQLDRRTCLWLGLSGADGLGADAADQRASTRPTTCPMPAR